MKVLIADKFPQSRLDRLRQSSVDVSIDPSLAGDALVDALAEFSPEILVVRSTRVEARHLAASAPLSLIIRAGAGVNTIDVAEASRLGIHVANCPGKNSIAVAELAFGHLLAMDRRLVDAAVDLRNGVWNKKEYGQARGVAGSTLGLIGFGGIGQAMASRALAFGMRVIAWSRSLTPEKAEQSGVECMSSPLEVARHCDVLSIHVALNDATRHLVDAELLAALPDGALVINTSRGAVVDQQALIAEVENRGLRAALDVFDGEVSGGQGTLEDASLFALDGVQGSHHIGASTQEAQFAVADEVIRIVTSFVDRGVVPNCVNLEQQSPATHLLVVRHKSRVGALAAVLDVLRGAGINVQEVENIIFAGAEAASAHLRLDQGPDADTLKAVEKSSEHIFAVTVKSL